MEKKTVQECLEMLGHKVEDKVTGFKGTVASISFDLYGCIQAVVQPDVDKDGKRQDGQWYDVNRLIIKGKNKVMEIDFFEDNSEKQIPVSLEKGPAEKPLKHQ